MLIENLKSFLTHPLNVALSTASVLAVVGLIAWSRRRRWVRVGTVGKLYIFPLKSGAVVESSKLNFQSMGPRLDRMIDRGFAVVNAGSQTIRDTHSFPRLCLVHLKLSSSGQVRLTSPDAEKDLVFSLPADFEKEPKSRFVSTSVIGGRCSSVWDCGEEAASWVSETLSKKERGLRLVYHHSPVSMRTHSPKYLEPFGDTMKPSALPALSNAAPYHLVTDSSLEDLNRNIPTQEKIDALNFRPNLVILTEDRRPYQEDRWELVRIGDVILEFSLPDNRCITVNYNQDTAKRDDGILKWLKTNRRTLTGRQEAVLGGRQGVFGHRYGLVSGTEGEVETGQQVWAYM